MVKGYQKIEKFLNVIAYFSSQQWHFRNKNTQDLFKKMSATDKREFDFDMGAFDWDSFFYTYVRGGRVQICISFSFTFLDLNLYL